MAAEGLSARLGHPFVALCVVSLARLQAGPVKDLYNMGYNPQYSLEHECTEAAEVWVLLTRHITAIDDFADNKVPQLCGLVQAKWKSV